MDPVDTVRKFIEVINLRDPDRLATMMPEDHVFVDSLGSRINGRESMRLGWRGYFALCPDYWISYDEIFARGDRVAIFGRAGGTIAIDGALSPKNQWQTPAAWLATVCEGGVKQWCVYADNKAVYDMLARRTG